MLTRIKHIALICPAILLAACSPIRSSPSPPPTQISTVVAEISIPAEGSETVVGLLENEIATLESLEKIDDHPLYTMRYFGAYDRPVAEIPTRERHPSWACSLFAAVADGENLLYGRNFDWQHSPAVLLFTDPPDGYASVSMVDIAYLGFEGLKSGQIKELPIAGRQSLLDAPRIPFDGMNEHGLVVGMAAVPPGGMTPDPDKPTIGSLGIIRQILDKAQTVEEAIDIFEQFNVDHGGGPPIHYLIADRYGEVVLVEFYKGEIVLTYADSAWHQTTNFLRASAGDSPEGRCWRYDLLMDRLTDAQGALTSTSAMELLADVAQENTQWSVVYDFSSGGINIAMDRTYSDVHSFQLDLAVP